VVLFVKDVHLSIKNASLLNLIWLTLFFSSGLHWFRPRCLVAHRFCHHTCLCHSRRDEEVPSKENEQALR